MNDKITLHKDTNLFGVDLKAGEYVRKKEWVGLTEEEIKATLESVDPETKRLPYGFKEFALAIEAKLKEKNA